MKSFVKVTSRPCSRVQLVVFLSICAVFAPITHSKCHAQSVEKRREERNKQLIDLMIAALSHKDENRRAGAANMLGRSTYIRATAKATPALKQAMINDSSELVRVLCAKAYWLLTGDNYDAVPLLMKGLQSKSDTIRGQATRAFIKVGTDGKRAIPLLKNLVHDKNVRIREAAIKALESKGRWAKIAVPDLVKALEDEEYKNSNEARNSDYAAMALAEIGVASKEVEQGLVKALDSKDAPTQVQSALTLATLKLKPAKLVPLLLKLVNCDDEYQASLAVKALGVFVLEDKRVYPVIENFVLDYLTDNENANLHAFFEAKTALVKSGAKAKGCYLEVSKILSNAKVDEEGKFPRTVETAIELIRDAGPHGKAAWPDLTRFVKAKAPHLSLTAAHAIWKLKGDQSELLRVMPKILNSKLAYLYFNVETIIEEMGPQAKALLPHIRTWGKDPEAVRAVVWLLGKLKANDKESLKICRNALRVGKPGTQFLAAESLWAITKESKEALAVLKPLLKHPNKATQFGAVLVIAKLGEAGRIVQPQLLKYLRGSVLRRQLASCRALSQIQFRNDKVLKALGKASEDRDPEVAEAAKKAIDKLQKSSK